MGRQHRPLSGYRVFLGRNLAVRDALVELHHLSTKVVMHEALTSSPRFYRPKEACVVLRVGMATLYRRIKAGDIVAIKFGGATLISQAEIDRVTVPKLGYQRPH